MSAYQCNFNIYILIVVQQNVSITCQQMMNKKRCHVGKKNTFYRSTDQFFPTNLPRKIQRNSRVV